MRRLMILAVLAGCTGANEAAPDERCEPFQKAESNVPVLADARGEIVRWSLGGGVLVDLWPGTTSPRAHLDGWERGGGQWGCWPGGSLAWECDWMMEDCLCHEAGQSWECPSAPGAWMTAESDAERANGPYVLVTQ